MIEHIPEFYQRLKSVLRTHPHKSEHEGMIQITFQKENGCEHERKQGRESGILVPVPTRHNLCRFLRPGKHEEVKRCSLQEAASIYQMFFMPTHRLHNIEIAFRVCIRIAIISIFFQPKPLQIATDFTKYKILQAIRCIFLTKRRFFRTSFLLQSMILFSCHLVYFCCATTALIELSQLYFAHLVCA